MSHVPFTELHTCYLNIKTKWLLKHLAMLLNRYHNTVLVNTKQTLKLAIRKTYSRKNETFVDTGNTAINQTISLQ